MGKKSRYITGFICVMPLALGLLIFRIYSFFENIYFSFAASCSEKLKNLRNHRLIRTQKQVLRTG